LRYEWGQEGKRREKSGVAFDLAFEMHEKPAVASKTF
jgi:hypothetical protein